MKIVNHLGFLWKEVETLEFLLQKWTENKAAFSRATLSGSNFHSHCFPHKSQRPTCCRYSKSPAAQIFQSKCFSFLCLLRERWAVCLTSWWCWGRPSSPSSSGRLLCDDRGQPNAAEKMERFINEKIKFSMTKLDRLTLTAKCCLKRCHVLNEKSLFLWKKGQTLTYNAERINVTSFSMYFIP